VAVSVADGASLVFGGAQHIASLTLLGNAIARFDSGMGIDDNFIVVVDDLLLDADSRLDIGSGAMIVQNIDIGWVGDGAYTGVTQRVASAYHYGAWDGPGITSRYAVPSNGVAGVGIGLGSAILGLPEGDSVGEWRGEAVSGNSVLITYTYMGDANLDGVIDGGDYGIIDNFVQVPGSFGYASGDFNYDGVIDGGDYGIIDNNLQAQGAPLV
jgi:hypothetical protein